MAYVIKRYSNRKLYDTQESRYVTLEEIEEMIRGGQGDLRRRRGLRRGPHLGHADPDHPRERAEHAASLPSAFLHQLIKHGEGWQDFVQRSMRSSLEGIVTSQREMERVFRDWAARAGWGGMGTSPAPAAEAKRDGAGDDAEKLREEVTALRERLRVARGAAGEAQGRGEVAACRQAA